MFGQKNKNTKSGWSQQPSSSTQEAFWEGGVTPTPDRPQNQSSGTSVGSSIPDFRVEGVPENLLQLFDPMFQFVCRMHRIDREGRDLICSQVRSECEAILAEIEKNSRADAVLQRQYQKLKDVLLWYVDYWFGSSGDFRSIRSEWNRDRMGEYPDDGDVVLGGDEAFFDELDKTMKIESSDEEANERLAFFYTSIGLGFQGPYFKSIPEHEEALKGYMDKLYPRVQKYVDTEITSRVTPECYQHIDRRDFVAPLRDRPLILMLATLFLLNSLFFGYMWYYGNHKKDLKRKIDDVLNTQAIEKI